jgi:hypothetical protein
MGPSGQQPPRTKRNVGLRVQKRLDEKPDKIPLRSKTVDHPFGTIKAWGDALQDEDAEARRHRNSSARAGLQSQEGDGADRRAETPQSNLRPFGTFAHRPPGRALPFSHSLV